MRARRPVFTLIVLFLILGAGAWYRISFLTSQTRDVPAPSSSATTTPTASKTDSKQNLEGTASSSPDAGLRGELDNTDPASASADLEALRKELGK